jgi:hypothetical protein
MEAQSGSRTECRERAIPGPRHKPNQPKQTPQPATVEITTPPYCSSWRRMGSALRANIMTVRPRRAAPDVPDTGRESTEGRADGPSVLAATQPQPLIQKRHAPNPPGAATSTTQPPHAAMAGAAPPRRLVVPLERRLLLGSVLLICTRTWGGKRGQAELTTQRARPSHPPPRCDRASRTGNNQGGARWPPFALVQTARLPAKPPSRAGRTRATAGRVPTADSAARRRPHARAGRARTLQVRVLHRVANRHDKHDDMDDGPIPALRHVLGVVVLEPAVLHHAILALERLQVRRVHWPAREVTAGASAWERTAKKRVVRGR